MMRRICKIVLTIGIITALLGAPTVAQASTTPTMAQPKVELVSYTYHHHHRHHHRARRGAPPRLLAYRWAKTQHRKPYIWGGTGPDGYDCSGLVYAAYRKVGIRLPRTTYDMLNSRKLVRIPRRKAETGDLAFFGPGHVELYVNEDTTFGAANPVDGIGWHDPNQWWAPDMYFKVRGAQVGRRIR